MSSIKANFDRKATALEVFASQGYEEPEEFDEINPHGNSWVALLFAVMVGTFFGMWMMVF